MLVRGCVVPLVLSFPAILNAQSSSATESQIIVATESPQAYQPYSATFETKEVQTLADGTKISKTTITKEARDSEGRTLHQTTTDWPGQLTGTFTIVFSEPEREVLQWDSNSNTVTVNHWGNPQTNPEKINRSQPLVRKGESSHGAIRVEQLGHKIIQGLDAEGTRHTRTIPEGAEGNDRPITLVDETWRSTDLGLVLESVSDDPRRGHVTREVREIERGEPDPSLFQAPQGYTIRNQTPQQ
jgi:hypothetical protein